MVQVPWPLTNAPGDYPQEGAGRLINVFVETRGDEQSIVWRRAPGTVVFTRDPAMGTAIGSAIALGISSVVDTEGSATGDSAASAESSPLIVRDTVGQSFADSVATAVGST